MSKRFENDDIEAVPAELNRETRIRLKRFAQATRMTPSQAASVLLTDLLADDEFWNAATTPRNLN
jgi:hypothetical protein